MKQLKAILALLAMLAVVAVVAGCETHQVGETQYKGGYREKANYQPKTSESGFHAPRNLY